MQNTQRVQKSLYTVLDTNRDLKPETNVDQMSQELKDTVPELIYDQYGH